MTDILSDVLKTLKLRGNMYFRTDLTSPWGIFVPADSNIARFHVVISGRCWLSIDEDIEPFLLSEGDLAIVPHGSSHRLMDDPKSPCKELAEVLAEQEYSGEGVLRYGGGGLTTSLVCGYFSFEDDLMHPLIQALPRKIHIQGTQNRNFLWLDTVMKFIGSEAEADHIGAMLIMERLSEILFIQVIRAYSKTAPESIGYLAALGDNHISRVLKKIHMKPGDKWNLETLSREAGLSRSGFAERFRNLMGMPPMEYLTRWRMIIAGAELRETQKQVIEIAEEVGYESEAAFSTAFKRLSGKSPSSYRILRVK